MGYYKAFIRVVKSLTGIENGCQHLYSLGCRIGVSNENIVSERLIEADSKDHVKDIMLNKYPQFFQNGKVYSRETKDSAQFFYLLIYPLYEYEISLVNEGSWVCDYCGHVHDNKYVSRPVVVNSIILLGEHDLLFCNSDDNYCQYQYNKANSIFMPDNPYHIKSDSSHYIYKITHKITGKCYIGKTRNAPFFRWWNHLTHSSSPFGIYLRSTSLCDWTFEVLCELDYETDDKDVLRIESEYIIKFDSINNGFNTVISNKQTLIDLGNKEQLSLNLD